MPRGQKHRNHVARASSRIAMPMTCNWRDAGLVAAGALGVLANGILDVADPNFPADHVDGNPVIAVVLHSTVFSKQHDRDLSCRPGFCYFRTECINYQTPMDCERSFCACKLVAARAPFERL